MRPRLLSASLAAFALLASATGCDLRSKEERRAIDAIHEAVEKRPEAVNAPIADGQPPLHYAVLNRYFDLVEWLLDHGASTQVLNPAGESALHVAAVASAEDYRALRMLLDSGAHPDTQSANGETPLHYAAFHTGVGAVDGLLAAHADPLARSPSGATPLHEASTPQPDVKDADVLAVIHSLVAAGADVDVRDNFDRTPLLLAALGGHLGAVQALLKEGADVDARGPVGMTALHVAASMNGVPVAKALLAAHANPNARDNDGRTPLAKARRAPAWHFEAGSSGPVSTEAVAQLLIQHGAVEVPADSPATATPTATLAEARLETPSAPTPEVRPLTPAATPLFDAVLAQNSETVATLVAAGADPLGPTPDGVPAAFLATRPDVIAAFRRAGVTLESSAPSGETFLAHFLSTHPDDPAALLLDGGFSAEELAAALERVRAPLAIADARSQLIPLLLLETDSRRIGARGLTIALSDLQPETLSYSLDPADLREGMLPAAGRPIRLEAPPGEYRIEQRAHASIQLDLEGPRYELAWHSRSSEWEPLRERAPGEFEAREVAPIEPAPYTMEELRAELRTNLDLREIADLVGREPVPGQTAFPSVAAAVDSIELRVSVRRGESWTPIKTIGLLLASGC